MDRLKHPNFKYIATTSGGTRKKRTIIKLSELSAKFDKPNCYRTWCRYEKDIVEYQNDNKGSLSGFNSKHYSDFFPMDIDNSENPKKSLTTCKNLIAFLDQQYEVPIESIRIYFSGSKGFHIEIPTNLFGDIEPSIDLTQRLKKIAKSFQFEGIDTMIYSRNSLWRLPNSINSKSKLYKIPITYNELTNLSYENLKELAKEPRYDINFTGWDEWEPLDGLVELWEEYKPKNAQNTVIKNSQNNKSVNIHTFGAKEGQRNKSAFQLAQSLEAQGWKINEIKDYIINKWNPFCDPPETNIQSLKNTVESACGYNHYDSGSIGITKHLRTDPYYNSLKAEQKAVYIEMLIRVNEVEKTAFGKYSVKPNQVIISYRRLAANAGVSPQIVRTLINKLVEWGRVTKKTLKSEKGMAECTRITFHCIDLTQYLTHQNPLSKDEDQLTQELTTTNIKKVKV